MGFSGRDIISIADLNQEEVMEVLKRARELVPAARGEAKDRSLEGKILASLFFEPSTRTRLSFEAAMQRLGGTVVGFSSAEGTSLAKGETLSDTVRMVEAYSDVLVLRHPQEGAARLAAEFSSHPVINAGDGAGQHPTQTLLDLYTIWDAKGRIEGNNVVLVGDLKYGRTVHSLSVALALFGAALTFAAPPTLQMPKEVLEQVQEMGVKPRVTSDLREAMAEADVLYVTRIQKERFPDLQEYAKVAGSYRIDLALLREAKRDLVVLHPLPRVEEVAAEVDRTPHALYFRQAFNGIPVRMALLSMVLGASG
jgi:aspartate carbamoyltransferase catalytic subunit